MPCGAKCPPRARLIPGAIPTDTGADRYRMVFVRHRRPTLPANASVKRYDTPPNHGSQPATNNYHGTG